MFTQNSVKTIDQEKKVWEYTTEELHSIIGNFEEEYHEAATGKIIHNSILGYVHEGNIEYALRIGAITKRENHYFIKLPEYRDYDLKLRALGELLKKRNYAQKVNNPISGMKDKIFNG